MRYLTLIALLAVLFSCDPKRVYEENQEIVGEFWYVDSLKSFEFEVPDATSRYNLYANITQQSDYHFYNLYYRYYLRDSTGKELVSDLANIDLFHPKTGEPLGDGLGDLFDNRDKILSTYEFPYAGKYKISFQQYMRMDSLPGIKSVGARLEVAD
ncbi:gliding motility lipoprotein GldH [Marinoscillum sp. MHG1-6]|uniref:gliding motility lipoprotein GldH n=1 Tax=Marinoscillum sp. MHG1-6 TaxID=2959627 RepID=UPI0021576455|nr:gliding motility lipoprotein GldH [Marinoscillum sp. MHG1-6]